MHVTFAALAVTGLAVQQATAFGGDGGGGYGGGWGGAASFSTPDNTDNRCTSEQSAGYNWTGLNPGTFSNYGSNTFSGWSCSNSFGKRDLLSRRTFQGKCISSNLDHEPSIGCDGTDKVSIEEYELSSDQDADLECHYEMPDGSSCKETHSCSKSGSVIRNSQCGGAKSVTFKPADNSKGKGCNIGLHSIGFNCGTASSSVQSYSATSTSVSSDPTPEVYATSTSISAAETTSSATAPGYETSSATTAPGHETSSTTNTPGYNTFSTATAPSYETTSTAAAPGHHSSSSSTEFFAFTFSYDTSTAPTAPGYETTPSSAEVSPTTTSASPSSAWAIPGYGNSSSTASVPGYGSSSTTSSAISSYTTSTVYSTTLETITSCAPEVTNCPASTGGSYVVTKTVAVSTTVCLVTPAGTPAESTPMPEGPNVLPKCLNTWLYLSGCKDNSDHECFCRNSEFITKVYACLSAWSDSNDATNSGAGYLMGICAKYIPENPAIITGCPSTITPATAYSPPTSTPGSPGKTIIQYSTVIDTITSCGPQVINCPASVHTSTYAIGTTVSTPPVPAPPAPAPPAPAPPVESQLGSTEGSPITSAAINSPPAVPCTTITYSSSHVIPAIYSTGESQGSPIPSSSYTTFIVTTVTVPQVQMTTFTVTASGSTRAVPGLGHGTPPIVAAPSRPAAATTHATAPAPAPDPTTSSAPGPVGPVGSTSTGFGTTYVPAQPSNSIVPYTAAGAKPSIGGLAVIAVGAAFLA